MEQKVVGLNRSNCWLLEPEGERVCAVVDPGARPRQLWKWISEKALNLQLILITHSHLDHLAAARYLQRKSKAPCLMHPLDIKGRWRWFGISFAKFTPVSDGQRFKLGSLPGTVIHTPGHSPGSISFLFEDCLFSGDLIFADGIGRWDIPGGDFPTLVKSLKQKLAPLPDPLNLFPGHGPRTTLGIERSRNPLLRPESSP